MEVWKDVVGYEGVYQVSNRGRVKRIGRAPGATVGRTLRLHKIVNGYLRVGLWHENREARILVHRLVLEAHIGPAPSPKHEGNHKNGDKTDNGVENLEWVTRSENHKHAYRVLGRQPAAPRGEACGASRLTRKQVRRIRRLYATGNYTLQELGQMFGVTRSTVSRIVRRETWKHV